VTEAIAADCRHHCDHRETREKSRVSLFSETGMSRLNHLEAGGRQQMSTTAPINITELISSRRIGKAQVMIVILCACIALLDGWDLQVIGLAAPSIARLLHIPPADMGAVFSAALAGLTLGSFGLGPVADRIGRKRVLVVSTLCFGIFTLLTPLASSYSALLTFRFLTGLGLGGAVPSFVALASEYTPSRHRASVVALLWVGFPLGGALGGLLGSWLIPNVGWQWLFWIGGTLPLVLTVLLLITLPESLGFLVYSKAPSAKIAALLKRYLGAEVPAGASFITGEERLPGGHVSKLFSDKRGFGTTLLWISSFIAFLELVTNSAWTPTLLSHVGVPIPTSALALATFNFGSVIGSCFSGFLLTRYGAKVIMPISFIGTLVSYGLIGYAAPNVGAIVGLEGLVGIFLGCGSTGLIALAAVFYPMPIRSTGVGWSVGMGRVGSFVGPLVVSALLAIGWAVGPIFAAIAAPALLAAITAGLIPRNSDS
jgi:AAHS family 4-hydroxybenzoate transporter-like MFS transporter